MKLLLVEDERRMAQALCEICRMKISKRRIKMICQPVMTKTPNPM